MPSGPNKDNSDNVGRQYIEIVCKPTDTVDSRGREMSSIGCILSDSYPTSICSSAPSQGRFVRLARLEFSISDAPSLVKIHCIPVGQTMGSSGFSASSLDGSRIPVGAQCLAAEFLVDSNAGSHSLCHYTCVHVGTVSFHLQPCHDPHLE